MSVATTHSPPDLTTLFGQHWPRISLTYVLYTIEEGLHLLRPFALGYTVDELLRGNVWGIGMIAGQHGGWLLVSTVRRLYDTRTFTNIYTRLATGVILSQQRQGVADSVVVARAGLSRKLVDFFEHDMTSLLTSVYNIVGSLVILSFYSLTLAGYCLLLFVPLLLLNRRYQRRVTYLTAEENDQQEREVAEISSRQPPRIQHHYERLRHWRIRLSDAEAFTYGWMEVFILTLVVAVLLYYCQPGTRSVGNILAVFEYVILFVNGLDQIPWLVQQVVNIRDVTGRLTTHEENKAETD